MLNKLIHKVSDWSNNVHIVINNTAQQSPSCHVIKNSKVDSNVIGEVMPLR